MESLRRLMSRKKNNPWKTANDTLEELLQQLAKQTAEFTNLQKENLGLQTKCVSLQRQFDYEATAIRKRLETQTAELTNLQKENLGLQTNCESLQRKFDSEATAIRKRLETQTAELTNLQKKNLLLKTNCESLQEQLHSERCKNVMNDHLHKIELEEEVNQRQLAQNENKAILKQRNELERQLVQVMQVYQINNYNQYQKNITIVNCPNCFWEGEESWHEQAMRAGVGCPSRYKILKRLQKYEEPNLNATFWELLVRLNLYEYLGKKRSF